LNVPKNFRRILVTVGMLAAAAASYWLEYGGIDNELTDEWRDEIYRPELKAFGEYIEGNTPSEEELRKAVNEFCLAVFEEEPVFIEFGREEYRFKSSHRENLECRLTFEGGWSENLGSINCITGKVSTFTNTNLPKNPDTEYRRGANTATNHSGEFEWVKFEPDLPDEPLSKEEGFELSRLARNYYGLSNDIADYEVVERETTTTYKIHFAHDGARHLDKYFQVTISRELGQIKEILHFSILEPPHEPEIVIGKMKALGLAKKAMRKLIFNKKFLKENFGGIYLPHGARLVDCDYDVKVEEIDHVIRNYGSFRSFHYWGVPFQLTIAEKGFDDENGKPIEPKGLIFINMETGQVRL